MISNTSDAFTPATKSSKSGENSVRKTGSQSTRRWKGVNSRLQLFVRPVKLSVSDENVELYRERTGDRGLSSATSTAVFHKQCNHRACFPLNSNKTPLRWSYDNTLLHNNVASLNCTLCGPLRGVGAIRRKYRPWFTDPPYSDASMRALMSGDIQQIVYSPAFNITGSSDPTYQTNALLGTTCYVEVRYNKEERSHWIRSYLAFHGAKVALTFSKKVTHVVFKEGRVSTYVKAIERNIPIVSLMWIHACNLVGGLVDPELFPPPDDEKYRNEVPLEEARIRRRFLRRGQAFLDRLNGILPPKAPRSRTKKKPKPSATEGKRKKSGKNSKTIEVETPNEGSNKLFFNSRCGEIKTDSDGEVVSEENALRNQKRRAPSVEAEKQGAKSSTVSGVSSRNSLACCELEKKSEAQELGNVTTVRSIQRLHPLDPPVILKGMTRSGRKIVPPKRLNL